MYCGTRLESMIPCSSCGRPLLASAPKCNYCGRAKSISMRPVTTQDLVKARMETFQAAEAARGARQFAVALPLYEQVVTVDPAHARAWVGLGKVLVHMQRVPEAVAALDRALALQPDLNEAAVLRKTLLPNKFPSSSVMQAVTMDTSIAAGVARALVMMHQGDFEHALGICETVLGILPDGALHPALAELHHTRAACMRELGRLNEALASCEHALRCEPRYSKAWLQKGELLAALERNDEALTALENAATYDVNDAHVLCIRGDVLRKMMRFEDALASYDRATAIDPTLERAREARAELLRR